MDNREKWRKFFEPYRYESKQGLGQRGIMDHHMDALGEFLEANADGLRTLLSPPSPDPGDVVERLKAWKKELDFARAEGDLILEDSYALEHLTDALGMILAEAFEKNNEINALTKERDSLREGMREIARVGFEMNAPSSDPKIGAIQGDGMRVVIRAVRAIATRHLGKDSKTHGNLIYNTRTGMEERLQALELSVLNLTSEQDSEIDRLSRVLCMVEDMAQSEPALETPEDGEVKDE